MKQTFQRLATFVGSLVLVYLIVVVAILGYRKYQERIPGRVVLEVHLDTQMVEYVPDDPVARAMLRDRVVVRDVVDALDRGSNDDRVVGLIAWIEAFPLPMAQAQEVRDAIERFRAKKKFAIAYSETFGEFGPANHAYYLATACDEIWLQPSVSPASWPSPCSWPALLRSLARASTATSATNTRTPSTPTPRKSSRPPIANPSAKWSRPGSTNWCAASPRDAA
jgi:hypothetical protein